MNPNVICSLAEADRKSCQRLFPPFIVVMLPALAITMFFSMLSTLLPALFKLS